MIITYVTFFLKDRFKIEKRNLAVVIILAILFMLFSHYVMDNTLLGEDHHGSESVQH